jgi:hypothetical protein
MEQLPVSRPAASITQAPKNNSRKMFPVCEFFADARYLSPRHENVVFDAELRTCSPSRHFFLFPLPPGKKLRINKCRGEEKPPGKRIQSRKAEGEIDYDDG